MYVYSFPKSGVVTLVGFDRLEPTGGANTGPGCPPEILNFTIPKAKNDSNSPVKFICKYDISESRFWSSLKPRSLVRHLFADVMFSIIVKHLFIALMQECHSIAHCMAGGCASVATSFIFTPTEHVKQQMQIGSHYRNCWYILKILPFSFSMQQTQQH